jgi:transposase
VAAPIKLDKQRQADIVAGLAAGLTRDCCAERAGISVRTFYKWLAAGRRGEKPFDAFATACRQAERNAEAEAVERIRSAAAKNWTAAAWWLERKFPESWGKEAELLREIIAAYRRDKRKGPEKK